MPRGRVPSSVGVATGRLPWRIGIKSLQQYRRDDAEGLSCREARALHRKIRIALGQYRAAHGGPKPNRSIKAKSKAEDDANVRAEKWAEAEGPRTRTEIKKAVERLKRAATAVLSSDYDEEPIDELANALSANVNLLADLHYAMRRRGATTDVWELRSRLDAWSISAADKAVIEILATLDVEAVVPQPGHPNPPLASLVPELMPIWRTVTGTSPYPKSNREGGKDCPFCTWLSALIKRAGLPCPPTTTLPRLVRLNTKEK